jgi:hypothetical protein
MTHTEIEQGDIVERYLLGRLSPDQEAEFEEHYLGCADCCERLKEDRRVIGLVRSGASGWERRGSLRRFWAAPAPAWGLAAALGAAAVYVSVVLPPSVVRTPQAPAVQSAQSGRPVVELSAYRAGEPPAPHAPAAAAFLLRLNLEGLAPAADAVVEIVGETGGSVFRRTGVAATGPRAEVEVSTGLPAGEYWVRLSVQSQLLREFALRVGP